MNLTLSVDEATVERARKVARAMGKSLNALVRDYLASLGSTTEVEAELQELRALSQSGKGDSRGWRFNREEAHERS